MTWAEFVRRVDAALAAQGLSRETEISWVDCSGMLREDRPDSPSVGIEQYGNGRVEIAISD